MNLHLLQTSQHIQSLIPPKRKRVSSKKTSWKFIKHLVWMNIVHGKEREREMSKERERYK